VKRRGATSLPLSALLVLGAWLVVGRPPVWHASDPPRAGLADLRDVAALRARFNADAGTVRLVLVLSPT
jgi:hypothetical protein